MAVNTDNITQFLEGIRDERRTHANTAERIGTALLMLLALVEKQLDLSVFLRNDIDNNAKGVIGFDKGLKLGDGGCGIDVFGEAVLRRIVSLGYDGATQHGFGIVDRGDGKFRLDIHDLQVWGKAVFQELEVRKLSYAGGNVYLSGSGGRIFKAEELYDNDKLRGWRCWLLADDGTTATQNMWRVGDQARCQTFGLADKQKPGWFTRLMDNIWPF